MFYTQNCTLYISYDNDKEIMFHDEDPLPQAIGISFLIVNLMFN